MTHEYAVSSFILADEAETPARPLELPLNATPVAEPPTASKKLEQKIFRNPDALKVLVAALHEKKLPNPNLPALTGMDRLRVRRKNKHHPLVAMGIAFINPMPSAQLMMFGFLKDASIAAPAVLEIRSVAGQSQDKAPSRQPVSPPTFFALAGETRRSRAISQLPYDRKVTIDGKPPEDWVAMTEASKFIPGYRSKS